MRQKRFLILSVLSFFGLTIGLAGLPAYGKGKSPKTVTNIPMSQIKLSAPSASDQQVYLGVQKDSVFTLNQTRAQFILIDVLNVFCPDCQKNAPQMNRIYNIVENDSDLKSDIKLIGIAVGNDDKQIAPYVAEFKIKFPVFPDPGNSIHTLLGGIEYPSLILADSKGNILFVHEGAIVDIDVLLEKLRDIHKKF